MITPEDEALFRCRYKGPQCEGNLAYAKGLACEYANRYAAGMPEWVKAGVASLHLRYVSTVDVADRQLLRIGIDLLLAVGRSCANACPTP